MRRICPRILIATDENEPGTNKKDTSGNKHQDHPIFSFLEQIKKLLIGTYKMVNGHIVPDNRFPIV
jgi:hypothetical protein